jgi:VWFA-related protein
LGVGIGAAGVLGAQDGDTLRVDVDLVTVVVTATDADGRYIPGLTTDDFRVEDNGVPQQIVAFTEDTETPVSLGIILDTSGSMVRRMRTALGAIDRFIRTLHPDDDVFLATFSGRTRVIQDFTNDRDRLTRALSSIQEGGGTALYDGLATGLDKIPDGQHDKRAILLLTDGADGSSRIGYPDILSRLRTTEVLVYALGIEPVQSDATEHVQFNWPAATLPGTRGLPSIPAIDRPVDMNVLRGLALASGGKSYLVSGVWAGPTIDDVDRILDEVAAELRSQYTMAYYPSNPGDGFHRIEVAVPGLDYTVRSREGYQLR